MYQQILKQDVGHSDHSSRRRSEEKQVLRENINSHSFSGNIIQRKAGCSCGGGCPRCQSESANLPVSKPTDASEIEADRVADKIMRMPENASLKSDNLSKNVSPAVHRKNEGNSNTGDKVSEHINSARSNGFSLEGNTRSFMENRFGADFGGVKIHTDGEAVKMNRDLGAKAFTVGDDIFFNKGQFQPESESGKHLLAHELTHVLQQENSGRMISKQDESDAETSGESPVETSADVTDDPCSYSGNANKEREVHLNLGIPAVRVYTKSGASYTTTQFDNIIIGPATSQLARQNGWCHMYRVQGHQRLSSRGLINFVNYCGHFGFHSNFWRKDGAVSRIPGSESHGCARLNDPDAASTRSGDSEQFYNLVQDGDCVRLYSQGFWRAPTFKPCRDNADCSLDD